MEGSQSVTLRVASIRLTYRAETQRGGAATKSISQKQTKETKNRKNFARNAEFSGIALRSAQSVFFIVLFSALRE
jgi:hypothetical protein